jgi:2-polyprenyl-3-methyl-5-hydroxy-6-metoxy-1,4-benzoquinol methylase
MVMEEEPGLIKDEPDYSHLGDREKYQRMYDEVGRVEANRQIRWREEWMHNFAPKPESSILELGAHNGPNLMYYGRLGHVVHGIDISDTLIETFNRCRDLESDDFKRRVWLKKAWIESYVPEREYDYVLVTEILEHVSDPVEVLRTAGRAVSASGEIYISSPTTHWGNNTHVRGVPPKELRVWLRKASLRAKKIWKEENGWTFCIAQRRSASFARLSSGLFRS